MIFRTFLLIFILFNLSPLQAQSSIIPEDCQKLIDKGNDYVAQKNYPQAFKSYAKAELIAKNNGFYVELCTVKNRIGNAYGDLSNFGEALEYYRQGLKIARENDEVKKKVAVTLSNIGRLYLRQNQIKMALTYYERAYKIAKENNSTYIVLVGLNLSDSYNKLEIPQKSLKYLDEIKPYPKSDLYQQVWEINYAESLFLLGHTSEAQKMMMTLLVETRKQKTGICNLCVMELLSRIHAAKGEIDKAIEFSKEGLRYNKELLCENKII